MEQIVKEIGAERVHHRRRHGEGLARRRGHETHPGVAADMFDALAAEGINIEMISTSPIRISCVIRRDDGERAVRPDPRAVRPRCDRILARHRHRLTDRREGRC